MKEKREKDVGLVVRGLRFEQIVCVDLNSMAKYIHNIMKRIGFFFLIN